MHDVPIDEEREYECAVLAGELGGSVCANLAGLLHAADVVGSLQEFCWIWGVVKDVSGCPDLDVHVHRHPVPNGLFASTSLLELFDDLVPDEHEIRLQTRFWLGDPAVGNWRSELGAVCLWLILAGVPSADRVRETSGG